MARINELQCPEYGVSLVNFFTSFFGEHLPEYGDYMGNRYIENNYLVGTRKIDSIAIGF